MLTYSVHSVWCKRCLTPVVVNTKQADTKYSPILSIVSMESSFSSGPGGGHCIDSSTNGITGKFLSRASSMAFWILALPAPSGPMQTTMHPWPWIGGSSNGEFSDDLSDRDVVKPFECNLREKDICRETMTINKKACTQHYIVQI